MKLAFRCAAAVTAICLPASAQAQVADNCMTSAELSSLFTYAVPDMVEAVSKKCSATLPANSFLRTRGPELTTRYRAASQGSWPTVKSAFMRTMAARSGGDQKAAKVMAGMPDAMLKTLLGTAFGVVVVDDLKVEHCSTVDRTVEALAPLPPANLGTLIASLVSLSGAKSNKGANICREG